MFIRNAVTPVNKTLIESGVFEQAQTSLNSRSAAVYHLFTLTAARLWQLGASFWLAGSENPTQRSKSSEAGVLRSRPGDRASARQYLALENAIGLKMQ
ncbi:MAG: hypothetical protein ACRCTD_09895 [Beijerinckiaceae bacterium]